ncbi:MAG: hypothetical protein E7429_02265 [Ruminococcaceae bacterium]|nr:hypothetical protein [Oscillospiraceae bacterium]
MLCKKVQKGTAYFIKLPDLPDQAVFCKFVVFATSYFVKIRTISISLYYVEDGVCFYFPVFAVRKTKRKCFGNFLGILWILRGKTGKSSYKNQLINWKIRV